MATANVVLRVEGQAVGLSWDFKLHVLVHDLVADVWRAATSGEVHCKLIRVRAWLPDVWEDEKETDSNGDARFNTYANYLAGEYKLEAEHNVSGDASGVWIACEDDGSWWIKEAYTP